MRTIRIGTRKSPLALAQAEETRARLSAAWPGIETEIVKIMTTGDQITDRLLREEGGKGLFTKEIEEALLDGRIDIAVHSMKDMPTVLPEGLIIGATLPREDARDMLIGAASIDALPKGATFGTSSLRRAAQVKHVRPDIQIVPLRGNVQTRLDKLARGDMAATMLALAGIKRLGLSDVPGGVLPLEQFIPAVAQGAIGIECRENDGEMLKLLTPLKHEATEIAVTCERAFLRELDGSCRTPIAGYAEIKNGQIEFRGFIAQEDGSGARETFISGRPEDAEALGIKAGQALKHQ